MDLRGKAIEVLNIGHGKKVKDFFKSKGICTYEFGFFNTKEDGDEIRYYYIGYDGIMGNNKLEYIKQNNIEIITLPLEKEFPRMMEVKSELCNTWIKGLVLGVYGGFYICDTGNKKSKKVSEHDSFFAYRYAREIEEPKIKEYTL